MYDLRSLITNTVTGDTGSGLFTFGTDGFYNVDVSLHPATRLSYLIRDHCEQWQCY